MGKKTPGVVIEPEHAQLHRASSGRWPQVGGSTRRANERIAARVGALRGLKLAGNAYDGIGVPDCIRLGRKAAKELVVESCERAAIGM